MLTVKFMKYKSMNAENQPTETEHIAIYHAPSIHITFEKDGRQVVQLGDAPNETVTMTVGLHREDTAYHRAYVMNEKGKTVETIW